MTMSSARRVARGSLLLVLLLAGCQSISPALAGKVLGAAAAALASPTPLVAPNAAQIATQAGNTAISNHGGSVIAGNTGNVTHDGDASGAHTPAATPSPQ
jgi:hypothetical protein